MNEVVQLIQYVGFPIVAFLLMYKMVDGTLKELRQTVAENTAVLREVKTVLERVNHSS